MARMSIPPSLAAEVARPRAERILLTSGDVPLTVVAAGPGWGKTTTVASWARRARAEGGRTVAWLTLSPADDSLAAFWDSVLQAVRGSGATAEASPLSVLSAAGGITEEVLLTVFRGLDAWPEPILLVLDDFHVITDERVMTALSDLVSRPTNVHVVLLTRIDPPLPLHRLRLAGALAEVSAADLAFDADAVRELAVRAESLDLVESALDDVLARTEGWPAGVRLATMYLAREGEDPGLEGFGGTDRSVAEYLIAEVLQRNTDEVRDFLLRTSVVELVSGDLADALVPDGGGRTRLEALEQANQFIVPADAERTLFRYHPLLRDLLLHTLQHGDPAAFREAHRAAASWFLGHRDPVRALGHAVSAEDWLLASEAFVDASPALVGVQGPVLAAHLRAIPFEDLDASAALELSAAGLEYLDGHFFAVEAHVAKARQLIAAGDRISPTAMALLENLACAVARASGDEAAVGDAAAAALGWVSQGVPRPAAEGLRLIALTQSAVALIRAGEFPAARERLSTVVRDSTRGDLALMLLGARSNLSLCDLVDGDLESAIDGAGRVIDDAAARGWTSLLQIRPAYLAVSIARMQRGELDSADRWVAAGLAATANGVEAWPTVALHLAQASAAVSRRRPRAASAAMAAARAAMRDRVVSPALQDTLTRVSAEVAMLTGTLEDDPGRDDGPGMSATDWSARARLAMARGDLDGALQAAGRVPRAPEPHGLDDLLAAIEAAICEALVAGRQRRLTQATGALTEALVLAADQRISRPFTLPIAGAIAPLLQVTPVVSDVAVFRDGLLRMLGETGGSAVPAPEPDPLLEPLTERELAVLAQLPTMRTNEEIARDFYISVNTVKSHLKHLYRKLGVTNRRAAVRRARELALLP